MYFALIPTQESIAELVACVRQRPETDEDIAKSVKEFHLTVLFSPDRKTQVNPLDVHALWVHKDQALASPVHGLHNFGPAGKTVWALQLAPLTWLVELRERCEELLGRYNIPWDKTWGFNPHLTICKTPGITLAGPLPASVRFDRLELRY